MEESRCFPCPEESSASEGLPRTPRQPPAARHLPKVHLQGFLQRSLAEGNKQGGTQTFVFPLAKRTHPGRLQTPKDREWGPGPEPWQQHSSRSPELLVEWDHSVPGAGGVSTSLDFSAPSPVPAAPPAGPALLLVALVAVIFNRHLLQRPGKPFLPAPCLFSHPSFSLSQAGGDGGSRGCSF